MFWYFFKKNMQMFTRYLHWRLFSFVGIITLFFVFHLYHSSIDTSFGVTFLRRLSILLFFLLTFLTPITCMQTLQQDKKTIDFILLSPIRYQTFVATKCILCIMVMIIYLFSLSPLFLLCYSLGGISPAQIFLIFCVLISIIVISASITLFFSSFFSLNPSNTGANIVLFVILILFNEKFFPTVAIFPSKTLMYCLQGDFTHADIYNIYFWGVISILLLLKVAQKFPWNLYQSKVPQDLDTETVNDEVAYDHWYTNEAHKQERQQRIKFYNNPVAWKDYFFIHYPKVWWYVKKQENELNFEERLIKVKFVQAIYIFTIFPIVFTIQLIHSGVGAFAKEKKVFELVLMTKLTNEEIVTGKIDSIRQSMKENTNIVMGMFLYPFFVFLFSFIFAIIALEWLIFFSFFVSILILATKSSMFFSFRTTNVFLATIESVTFLVISQGILLVSTLQLDLYFSFSFPINHLIFFVPVAINSFISYCFYRYMTKYLRSEKFIQRLSRLT